MTMVCGWAFLLIACSSKPSAVPTTFTETTDSLAMYPDYRDVTIPPNIAPLNFQLTDSSATEYVVAFDAEATPEVGFTCGACEDGKIDIDLPLWRQLLHDARGQSITVCVYAHRPAGWVRYQPFTMRVAEEEIDPYLTYRLIEPGYEYYSQLGIYQRNLTNFDVETVYENDRTFSSDNCHCINCHNFQANDTERMILHVRENHKGTIVTHGNDAYKMIIKHDSILASGAYACWHPTLPLVAFSSNKTAQVFHMHYNEKIEVYDAASDLILFDADNNEVRTILRTSDHFETFPCWSADGTRLYYCTARLPKMPEENFEANLVLRYDSLLYDIYSMPFDTVTYTFGEPQIEINASAQHKSCSVPRVSPDGRYLVFAYASYGQFHLYHKDSDLWCKDLQEGNLYPLTDSNSNDVESYHSWSSNSRWQVFSSRRDDGDYTRTYIAYFDAQGQGHRAFLLPQRDPEYNLLLLKSYNCPELTKNAVQVSTEQIRHLIYNTEAELATYKE